MTANADVATAPAQVEDAPPDASSAESELADPYLWLEEVDGERALEWVRGQNAQTEGSLTRGELFKTLHREAIEVLGSDSRIPGVTIRGRYLYNFWRDEAHPRGVYRRTTLREYRKAKPRWQTVLDIDALSAAEGVKWVFKGMSCLPKSYRHCLIRLSPGGTDASELREFDARTLKFVADGFNLPAAKSDVTWLERDRLLVATDFGPGTLTKAKYPRRMVEWRRGQPLSEATSVFEAPAADGRVSSQRLRTNDTSIDLVYEAINFWERKQYQWHEGEVHRLHVPTTAVIHGAFRGRLVIGLKHDWFYGGRTYAQGSVLLADPRELWETQGANIEILILPSQREVVKSVHADDGAIVVGLLEDVRGRVDRYEWTARGWNKRRLALPDDGAVGVSSIDDDSSQMFVRYESFTQPATLYYMKGPEWRPEQVKTAEPTFDATRFVSEQHWVESKDGTRVPYFMVRAKDTVLDGKNPTHIFGYGGFRVAMTPSYSGTYESTSGAYGKMWLERGGVFVLANLRGGGEFGPAWHAGVLEHNRPKVYEDLEAIATDLFDRKVTSPAHLGIEGRSNGGLLVSAAMTRRPDLYGAVICGVPLTDMRRYHQMLAGELWVAEYGNPDNPEHWKFLRNYSPYHNLRKDAEYPDILFYTSTRDDRVHPAHARKMAAKMVDMGHAVEYYENIEGGHAGSSTNEQLAYRLALTYTHLWTHLARPKSAN